MNNDLDQFENRSDDWLAKERKHEEQVSAWDLDEAKKIKEYHEENCEAEEIKENHHKAHVEYIKNQSREGQRQLAKKEASLILIVMIAILLIMMIIMITTGSEIPYFVTMIIIISSIVSLTSLKGRKK